MFIGVALGIRAFWRTEPAVRADDAYMAARKKEVILVTGGAGRLGRALVRRLLSDGREVRVLVDGKEDILSITQGAVPYLGNIVDSAAMARACKDVDTVFHLAAIVSQYRLGSAEILRTNTMGTKVLLDAANDAGANKLLFSSTLNVYGRVRKERLTETSEPRPTDTYGQSKALAEKEIIRSGINYTIFRMATIYGPGFSNSFMKMFDMVRQGKAYIIGKGRNHIPLLHVSDAVNAFILAMDKRISTNSIYNLSDGQDYTQEYLFDFIAGLIGTKRPDRHVHPMLVKAVSKSRGLDIDEVRFMTTDRLVDISKAKKQLGWKPKMTIESDSSYLLAQWEAPPQR